MDPEDLDDTRTPEDETAWQVHIKQLRAWKDDPDPNAFALVSREVFDLAIDFVAEYPGPAPSKISLRPNEVVLEWTNHVEPGAIEFIAITAQGTRQELYKDGKPFRLSSYRHSVFDQIDDMLREAGFDPQFQRN